MDTNMFKRFECGCIGFVILNKAWCVKPCDGDGDTPSLTMFRRDTLLEKTSTKLKYDELDSLMEEIATLVRDGNDLRNLRSAFEIAGLSNRVDK